MADGRRKDTQHRESHVKGEWRTPGRHQDTKPHAAGDVGKLVPATQTKLKNAHVAAVRGKWYNQFGKQFENVLIVKHTLIPWPRNSTCKIFTQEK